MLRMLPNLYEFFGIVQMPKKYLEPFGKNGVPVVEAEAVEAVEAVEAWEGVVVVEAASLEVSLDPPMAVVRA